LAGEHGLAGHIAEFVVAKQVDLSLAEGVCDLALLDDDQAATTTPLATAGELYVDPGCQSGIRDICPCLNLCEEVLRLETNRAGTDGKPPWIERGREPCPAGYRRLLARLETGADRRSESERTTLAPPAQGRA
jgi:hypothetical protein